MACINTPSVVAPVSFALNLGELDEPKTTAQEAIETADAHLGNAVLPTYSQLRAALESFMRAPSVGSNGPGSSTIVVQEFNLRAARALLDRHDKTLAGNFGA